MSWEKKTLDQLGSVSRGKSKHRPRNDPKLFGGQYPFIQTADVKNANFYITEYSDTYNETGLAQSKLWDIGTLCITIAANIADTGILGIPACFPDSVMGFIPYDGVSDVRFVKYCFDMLQRDCKQISQGTAQDNLSWQKLSTIEFPAPPFENQHRIADILSAYDDLIENNRKQIKLLEEAAQRLYKEWFVDLRFPGHEHTKIMDGVPDGWEKSTVASVSSVLRRGISPRYNENGKSIVINQKCIRQTVVTFDESRRQEKPYPEDLNLQDSDTVICSTGAGTLGRVGQIFGDYSDTTFDSHVTLIRAKEGFEKQYLFQSLKARQTYLMGMGKGSTNQLELSRGTIQDLDIHIPSKKVLNQFEQVAQPMHDKISVISKSILQLQTVRDRLLPKLMSGEIELKK